MASYFSSLPLHSYGMIHGGAAWTGSSLGSVQLVRPSLEGALCCKCSRNVCQGPSWVYSCGRGGQFSTQGGCHGDEWHGCSMTPATASTGSPGLNVWVGSHWGSPPGSWKIECARGLGFSTPAGPPSAQVPACLVSSLGHPPHPALPKRQENSPHSLGVSPRLGVPLSIQDRGCCLPIPSPYSHSLCLL